MPQPPGRTAATQLRTSSVSSSMRSLPVILGSEGRIPRVRKLIARDWPEVSESVSYRSSRESTETVK